MALGRRLGIMNSCQMTAHLSAFVDRSYRAFSEPDDMIARLTTHTHQERQVVPLVSRIIKRPHELPGQPLLACWCLILLVVFNHNHFWPLHLVVFNLNHF